MKKTFRTILPLALSTVLAAVIFMLGSGHVFAATATGTTKYCQGAPSVLVGDANTTYQLGDIIKYVVCFLEQSIVPFLFALAIGVFIYGMIKFIGTQDSGEREQGKQFMLWGVIALAVMFSVWGLVSILGNTFGVRNAIPQLPVN